MPNKRDVHTVPNPEGSGWRNRVGGELQRTVHRTQEAAADRGRGIARQNHSEHFIHGRTGQIRERNSYGPDKFPPRG